MQLKAFVRSAFTVFRQTFADWNDDNVPRLGAALAFYAALSIAPLLVLSLRVAAFIFGNDAARGEILQQFQSLVGDAGSEALKAILENSNRPENGMLATVLSFIALFFGASGVFSELQDSLNIIWRVKQKPDQRIWVYLRDRLFSMVLVLCVAILLLVSLVVSALLSFAGSYTVQMTGGLEWLSRLVHVAISICVFFGIFAMTFKYLPDTTIAWKDVWLGALITAVLFTIGNVVIGLYFGRSATASAYGAAGSLIALLVWIYYSAQIMFFGAEFTHVFGNRFGSKSPMLDTAIATRTNSGASPGQVSKG